MTSTTTNLVLPVSDAPGGPVAIRLQLPTGLLTVHSPEGALIRDVIRGLRLLADELDVGAFAQDLAGLADPAADPADMFDDAEVLAWYRATYDDDQADDDLVLARMAAWARGQSLGPDVQGIPRRPGPAAERPF